MKKIEIKKSPYIFSLVGTWVVGFLLVTVCYFTMHLPKKEVLAQLRRQSVESQDMLVIAHRAARQDMREDIQQQLDQTKKAVSHFSVPRQNTTALVFEIGKIANELGLSEFSSKNRLVRDIPTVGDSQTVTENWIEVEFKSSFLDFAQFINRLERQSPAVFVERLTLRKNENGKFENNIKMELSFLVTNDEDNPVAMANSSVGSDSNANRQY